MPSNSISIVEPRREQQHNSTNFSMLIEKFLDADYTAIIIEALRSDAFLADCTNNRFLLIKAAFR
jgi:hypothetical protein